MSNMPDKDLAGGWPVPRLNECSAQGTYHVIVVGAGVGGLSAAALLACRGFKVLVVERHHKVGGNCTSWRRRVPLSGGAGDFVFDCGVQDISGLGPNGPLNNLLRQIRAADRISWKRVHHLYWMNGIRLNGGNSCAEYVEELCRQFPGESAGIKSFFSEMGAVYRELYADSAKTGGIPATPTLSAFRDWPQTHPHAFRWLRRSFEEMLQTYLSNGVIHAVIQTISEYITEEPRRPLVLDMAPLFGYYFEGGYYPGGGSQRLPQLLANIVEEHRGKILLDTSVEKLHIENGHVAGILTSRGERLFAPLVVANGDVVAMLTTLISEPILPKRYASRITQLARGPSAIVVNVALSIIMPLPARIFIRNNGLSFGIGNPSVLDPTLAPDGHSAVTILLLLSESEAATWLDKLSGNYTARKENVADQLFAAIETSVLPDFRKYIVHKEIATPASFAAFTGARNGNIYGAACAGWRPGLQSPVPGLLLVGGGTETGPGIEAVVISGMRAANLISEAQID